MFFSHMSKIAVCSAVFSAAYLHAIPAEDRALFASKIKDLRKASSAQIIQEILSQEKSIRDAGLDLLSEKFKEVIAHSAKELGLNPLQSFIAAHYVYHALVLEGPWGIADHLRFKDATAGRSTIWFSNWNTSRIPLKNAITASADAAFPYPKNSEFKRLASVEEQQKIVHEELEEAVLEDFKHFEKILAEADSFQKAVSMFYGFEFFMLEWFIAGNGDRLIKESLRQIAQGISEDVSLEKFNERMRFENVWGDSMASHHRMFYRTMRELRSELKVD
jgi:hypothetical protein